MLRILALACGVAKSASAFWTSVQINFTESGLTWTTSGAANLRAALAQTALAFERASVARCKLPDEYEVEENLANINAAFNSLSACSSCCAVSASSSVFRLFIYSNFTAAHGSHGNRPRQRMPKCPYQLATIALIARRCWW